MFKRFEVDFLLVLELKFDLIFNLTKNEGYFSKEPIAKIYAQCKTKFDS
jgi:hypothetical protein